MPRVTLTPEQQAVYEYAVARYLSVNPQQSAASIAVFLSLTTTAELAAVVRQQLSLIRAELVAQDAGLDAATDATRARIRAQIAAIDSFPV